MSQDREVARRLRQARKQAGLTQEQAANLYQGINGTSWSNPKSSWASLEASRDPAYPVRNFSAQDLYDLSEAVRCDPVWLLTGIEREIDLLPVLEALSTYRDLVSDTQKVGTELDRLIGEALGPNEDGLR